MAKAKAENTMRAFPEVRQLSVGDTIQTPDGKAVVEIVDFDARAVRVKHLDAKTAVTDYRFSDIKFSD